MRNRIACVLALLFSAAAVLAAGNMQGNASQNEGIIAVRRTSPIVIDGYDDEWAAYANAEIESFPDFGIRDEYSVGVIAVWDDEALYMRFRWRDPTPLYSRINPATDKTTGWKADAEQLRVWCGDDYFYLTAWSYLGRTNACLWERFRKGTPAGLEKVEEEYSYGPVTGISSEYSLTDGGFIHELRIPWRYLGVQAGQARAGFIFKLGMEFLWGAENGRDVPILRYADNMQPGCTDREFYCVKPAAWGDCELSETLPAAKRAYVPQRTGAAGGSTYATVIEDADGNRIRNFVAEGAAGEWDGRDDDGLLVKPGRYVSRTVETGPLHARYIRHFYNPGDPPWLTPDGKGGWTSDHLNVRAIVRAGEKMILASPFTEGGYGIVAVDLEGRKLWSELPGCGDGGAIAVSADGTKIYMVPEFRPYSGKVLLVFDAETGSYTSEPVDATNRLDVVLGADRRAVDARGRVWEASIDRSPRRITVTGTDGRIEKTFLGGTEYMCSGTWLHESDPMRAYAEGNEIYLDPAVPQGVYHGTLETHDRLLRGNCNGEVFFFHGREYLFAPAALETGVVADWYLKGEDGRWRHVAGIFNVAHLQGLYGETDYWESAWWRGTLIVRPPEGEFAGNDPADLLFWSDLDGNGAVTKEECTVVPAREKTKYPADLVTPVSGYGLSGKPDFPMYGAGWYRRCDKRDLGFYLSYRDRSGVYRLAPSRFLEDGTPVYDPSALRRLEDVSEQWALRESCPVPGSDTVVAFGEYRREPGARVENWLIGFNGMTGKFRWRYPLPYFHVHGSHSAPMPRPGLVIGALRIMGAAGGVDGRPGIVALRGNHGSDFYFDEDGFYLGSLFHDSRLPAPPLPAKEADLVGKWCDRFSNGSEPFSGWFGRHDDGVLRETVSLARQAPGIVELEGLETAGSPVEKEIVLSEEHLVAMAAKQESEEGDAPVPACFVIGESESSSKTYLLRRAGFPEFATVKAWDDGKELHFVWQITDKSPWRNSAREPEFLFKGGDCVDVQFEGVRYLGAGFQGRDVVLEMRREGEGREYTYFSPVMSERFAHVGISETARLVRGGDRVEMILPSGDYGRKIDVGVIFSDADGRANAARVYLFNRRTGLVSDIPNEARINTGALGTVWTLH
ncbi:MAG: hypothetical protein ACOX5G_04735 [Kiritimatiellia bacterium]|jgi:hypothetical protein